jgi:ABC-type branched-subunit amino acid transport system substrate-binding protein
VTAGFGGTRTARRRVSRLAVLAVVALVVSMLSSTAGAAPSDDISDAQRNAALVKAGPMTPAKAELLGKTVDFGPNCDVTTGRVKLPTVYAPPCVQPLTGKNGGATSQGVTDKAVKVVVWVGDPTKDPVLAGQIIAAGASLDVNTIKATWQGYVDIYNQVLELYGRKIDVEFFDGTGSGADTAAAKSDAIAIADKKPFAVMGGPGQSVSVFSDELAHRGVMCLGTCADTVPQRIATQGQPYIFTDAPSPEQSALLAADVIGKQAAPGEAQYAGDEATKTKKRVYGIAHYDTPDGQYKDQFDTLTAGLKKHKIVAKTDQSFFLDPAKTQETARTIITKFKDAGITTVIYTGDPLTPGALTKEATAQDYHPEWVIGPTAAADTTFIGRLTDQEQWAHAFGVGLFPGRVPQASNPNYFLYTWFHGSPPPNNLYNVIGPTASLLGSGLTMAGPKLTPKAFRDGLFRYPPSGGDPVNPKQSWGKHGLWPSVDYWGSDDAGIVWWDASATGEDEIGQSGKGIYQYADGAKRFTLGKFPGPGQARPFDAATSVTVFPQLPPESSTPSYPSPSPAPVG